MGEEGWGANGGGVITFYALKRRGSQKMGFGKGHTIFCQHYCLFTQNKSSKYCKQIICLGYTNEEGYILICRELGEDIRKTYLEKMHQPSPIQPHPLLFSDKRQVAYDTIYHCQLCIPDVHNRCKARIF